mmetsp:Transcript_61090/g.71024  ORF Transcript_61090/g.71024 Transcript_61090/m.71024 type:complete len:344 (+) Transcript_61090:160-1191(+)
MSSDSAATATTVPAAAAAAPAVDYYFDSYSHYGIHMEMLKDYQRTTSYRDAMLKNRHMFHDKVVLDVGCGTGILSMFAAKAGARKVIGIDCSSVAVQAREIVKKNGLDHIITILQGKVEEQKIDDKVDIIISEWMGYFLLYESMLNTVLFARDTWGAPGVKLLPDKANMYVCGVEDEQYVHEKFDVWNNVEGFDFSYFRRLSYIEPLIDTVERSQIMTNVSPLASFDLNTVTVPELNFKSDFRLVAQKDNVVVHALSVHFDTPFTAGHEHVVLDTSPMVPPTHWRQTVLYLINPIRMRQGEHMQCKMTCTPNPGNPRDLDISLHVDFEGQFQISHFDQDFRIR